MNQQPDYYPNSIAIIGMAGRFPKAHNIEQFWHNLVNGVESIDTLTDEQLAAVELDFAKVKDDPDYVRARGMLDGIDLFDANFFGLTPREARALDPQHRLWLETAWEALETAAYAPSKTSGAIGVFAGNYYNSYVFYNLMADRAAIEGQVRFRSLDSFINLISNDKDYLPTRTSYLFDLKGPSVNVQTACSTSLVAVAQACQSLLNYESDICLAGGVCVAVPQERGYLYQEGGMTSADGHCRPYDANANGTVFSSGVGVVVLKRLEEAVADGDHITAIIRATALNNDGAHKVSYTAPSVDGQAEVIALAQAIAGVDPETISYIEGHGTATPLGDPIEVAGLTKAFRKQTAQVQFCGLGSVKSNVGHLDAASGVTGLIKTALALHHEQIPATLHFEQPNPEIDLANSPFYVVNELTPWPKSATPRRAGVSSFGVGGTNAHVILEEAPEPQPSGSSRPRQLLLLSGKTETAVSNLSHQLADHLEAAAPNLADTAYTLAVGRTDHAYRRAVVADGVETAVSALRQTAPASKAVEKNPPVVFMFPGQGAQHVNMGRELYETEPIFREAVDACAEILRPLLDLDIRELLYPAEEDDTLAARLEQTAVAQPAIFTIEYALAQLWLAWGVRPSALVGHSVGEFAAACLAGVFSLEDALAILATRARLMQAVAPGSMRAVRLSEEELLPYLTDGVSLAANNAPNLCVVSGPKDAIVAFDQRLESQGIATIELHTSHAFHSAMMDDVLEPFAAAVAAAGRSTPTIPILSTLTGQWLTDEQATDPGYWTQQLRQPVRFSQAVRALQEMPGRVYLEVGPGSTLSTAVRQHPDPTQTVISSLGHAKTPQPALHTVLEAAGRLWQAGVAIDWTGFYQDETRRRLPLPTYPFERQRYWVEPPPLKLEQPLVITKPHAAELEPAVVAVATQEEAMTTSRRHQVTAKLGTILHELSGIEFAAVQYATPFIELGFDSLTLTQVSSSLKSELGVAIKFRELLENVSTVDALADYCLERIPAEMFAEPIAQPVAQPVAQPIAQAVAVGGGSVGMQTAVSLPSTNGIGNGNGHGTKASSAVQQLIEQQLQIMQQQLQLLGGGQTTVPQVVEKVVVKEQKPARFKAPAKTTAPETLKPGGFGPYSPVRRRDDGNLTHSQQAHLDQLIERFVSRTRLSKDHAQQYRLVLAYPRSIYGYRRLWKEMVYQLVAERSKGARLWDIDGNEYVDMTLGFGINFLGHSPDFVTEAVRAELEKGVEVGPHSRLAGEIATMIRQMTGVERVSFCNTGSEAVMAAVRIARTVTGREKIVYFSGDYHGVFDEVLARPQVIKGELHTMPAVPGILPASVENVYILDYGLPESLEFIRQHADELAAVLVEPVQSRHPYNRPVEFLRELRQITRSSGTALILDEIVTGFRVHQGGIQKAWGIEADLVTYGKIVGGGMPIGIVAGKAAFMNALDGGQWNYGDDSEPEADLTFFAGTFIRHPLAMAAAHAAMRHLLAEGPQLQERVNQRTTAFVEKMNAFFENVQVPIRLRHYSSWFRFDYPADLPYMELIAFHLLTKGVYVLSLGQNFFFSTQHSDDDIAFVTKALQESILELQTAGFLPASDKTPFPLTEAQQEIWLASQMGETASCAYNETLTVRLTGQLEAAAFVEAVQTVLRRHDALHMRFAANGEWQRRADEINVAVPLLDWSGLDGEEQAERVKTAVSQQATTPFDLVNGPLVRPQLIKLSSDEHIFLFCGHHIAFDGWSFGLMVDELKTVYNALLDGQGYTLPDPESYRTYAQFEAALQASDEGKEALAYWLEQLRDAPSHTPLPTDR
ncbi:MAG: aminotransferase class III-fold pyridoxal phosphate-dependent enzyme, partial [Anaerolineales bacterium]|nr:aminotransferase class III-fold pyridoxal phosphate-dependent enzyme [Anaerolineales bacterium]